MKTDLIIDIIIDILFLITSIGALYLAISFHNAIIIVLGIVSCVFWLFITISAIGRYIKKDWYS